MDFGTSVHEERDHLRDGVVTHSQLQYAMEELPTLQAKQIRLSGAMRKGFDHLRVLDGWIGEARLADGWERRDVLEEIWDQICALNLRWEWAEFDVL